MGVLFTYGGITMSPRTTATAETVDRIRPSIADLVLALVFLLLGWGGAVLLMGYTDVRTPANASGVRRLVALATMALPFALPLVFFLIGLLRRRQRGNGAVWLTILGVLLGILAGVVGHLAALGLSLLG